jgi:hypothetical protein
MKKIFSLSIVLLFTSNLIVAQNCNCKTNFEWVKKTFEENDAGFKYTIESKGTQAYQNHNQLFLQKIKGIKKTEECTKALYEWLTFFRTGHIAIRQLDTNIANSKQSDKEQTTGNWETLNVDLPEFEKYLSSKNETDFEGIWETNPYKIGIKKVGDSYLGFIIEAGNSSWKKGQIKIRIKDNSGTFYLRDKSPLDFTNPNLLGENHLQLGNFTLNRLNPKHETEKDIQQYFNLLSSQKPFIEELNKTTLIFRIPSFDGSQRAIIDSVIAINKEKILKTENLIIDLRNNGGGSDGSYKGILPFLYTNPIREIGVSLLSTKLNNQRMLDFINKPEYGFNDEEKKWAKESYDKLEKQLGQFVNLDTTTVSIQKLEKINPYPKNVGIIINDGNGSTTEQFLLAVKQSKKVKLFGTTTFGVLDISNMNFVKSPCNQFELGYSLSKSFRIPNMTIDSKGIQPDYYIDESIPNYKWVEYVNETLNQK